MRRGFLALFFGLIVMAWILLPSTGAMAQSSDIDVAPPEAIYEVNPGDREGYIWSDGSWRWDGKRHRWHPGYWVAARPGYQWIPDAWVKRGKKWHFNKGHWEADEDTAALEENSKAADEALAATEIAAEPEAASAGKPKAKYCKHCKPKRSVNYKDQKTWPFAPRH